VRTRKVATSRLLGQFWLNALLNSTNDSYSSSLNRSQVRLYHLRQHFIGHGCYIPLRISLNPLISTLKPQSNGPLYNNTVIGTVAVDGWAVTFGTARRGLGGLRPRPVPHRCTKCNSPPVNGQCTNFILF